MIKMKLLLDEDIDGDIKEKIDELGSLETMIDELQKRLKPLKEKYGELVENVLPIVSQLGKEQVKTQNYVLKIIRKGYQKQSFQYKEGFNKALEKVNDNIKNILLHVLKDTRKVIEVSPKFRIEPLNEGFMEWLKNRTQRIMKKIVPWFKLVVSGNKELRRLV